MFSQVTLGRLKKGSPSGINPTTCTPFSFCFVKYTQAIPKVTINRDAGIFGFHFFRMINKRILTRPMISVGKCTGVALLKNDPMTR